MHLLAAGIDRVFPVRLPTLQRLGVAGRVGFTQEEVASAQLFEVEVNVEAPGGERIAGVRGTVGIDSPGMVDSQLPALGGVALNLLVPLQTSGVHTVSLSIDGEVMKSIPFVVQPSTDVNDGSRQREA
jgi:hypothetical protein